MKKPRQRSLRSGGVYGGRGHAVLAAWGPRERNPWLGILFHAVTAETRCARAPARHSRAVSLEAPGARRSAGWRRFLEHRGPRDPGADEGFFFDDWWSVVPPLAGPIARVLGSLPAEVSEAIHAHAAEAMADFAKPDGYELPGVSVVGIGTH